MFIDIDYWWRNYFLEIGKYANILLNTKFDRAWDVNMKNLLEIYILNIVCAVFANFPQSTRVMSPRYYKDFKWKAYFLLFEKEKSLPVTHTGIVIHDLEISYNPRKFLIHVRINSRTFAQSFSFNLILQLFQKKSF